MQPRLTAVIAELLSLHERVTEQQDNAAGEGNKAEAERCEQIALHIEDALNALAEARSALD